MATHPPIALEHKIMLTVREAAALTGLPRDYVYGLVRSGEWPCIRTGDNGAWHVSRAAIESWVARRAEVAS